MRGFPFILEAEGVDPITVICIALQSSAVAQRVAMRDLKRIPARRPKLGATTTSPVETVGKWPLRPGVALVK
jgi:hypothetical protein